MRILILAIGRINKVDNSNNGLLLRNLLGIYPKQDLGQIYSSGHNGDEGFFTHYYHLSPDDRRFGKFFLKQKSSYLRLVSPGSSDGSINPKGLISNIRSRLTKYFFLNSGLYEIIHMPRVSRKMLNWINAFKPDVILSQGYNLTFTFLAIKIQKMVNLPLIYYPTDDWPNDLYNSTKGSSKAILPLVRFIVKYSSRKLVSHASLRIVFNNYMLEEYERRYKKGFHVIMHGDSNTRFIISQELRKSRENEIRIVTMGVFDGHRLPLLYDLEEACRIIIKRGINISAKAFFINPNDGFSSCGISFNNVIIEDCPHHDLIPLILQDSDILFLPERFDESSDRIKLSISTKAHLFMFSRKPIIVYSAPQTGIARYASDEGWAFVLCERNPTELANVIEKMYRDNEYSSKFIKRSILVSERNHDIEENQRRFQELVSKITNY